MVERHTVISERSELFPSDFESLPLVHEAFLMVMLRDIEVTVRLKKEDPAGGSEANEPTAEHEKDFAIDQSRPLSSQEIVSKLKAGGTTLLSTTEMVASLDAGDKLFIDDVVWMIAEKTYQKVRYNKKIYPTFPGSGAEASDFIMDLFHEVPQTNSPDVVNHLRKFAETAHEIISEDADLREAIVGYLMYYTQKDKKVDLLEVIATQGIEARVVDDSELRLDDGEGGTFQPEVGNIVRDLIYSSGGNTLDRTDALQLVYMLVGSAIYDVDSNRGVVLRSLRRFYQKYTGVVLPTQKANLYMDYVTAWVEALDEDESRTNKRRKKRIQ